MGESSPKMVKRIGGGVMEIKVNRYCSITGETYQMVIDSTPDLLERIAAWDNWANEHTEPRPNIKDFFGDLTSGERDFIQDGITPNLDDEIFENLYGSE